MNSPTRKSMDGVRTSKQKRTSESRSFPRENIQEIQAIETKKRITKKENTVYQKANNSSFSSVKKSENNFSKLILGFLFRKKTYFVLGKLVIAIFVIIYVGNRFEKTLISIQPHIEYQDVDLRTEVYRNPQGNQLGFDVIAVTDEVSLPAEVEIEMGGGQVLEEGYATGIVELSNRYSEEPQELNSGTRIVSDTGKIYLLPEKTTIIPGRKENKPGTVQVQVTALESGDDSVISKTSFTIPGYKELGFDDKYVSIKGEAISPIQIQAVPQNTSARAFGDTSTIENNLQIALSERLTQRLDLEKTDEFIVIKGTEKVIAQPTEYLRGEDGQGLATKRGTVFALLIGNDALAKFIMDEHLDREQGQEFTILNPNSFRISTSKTDIDYEKSSYIDIQIAGRPLFESVINPVDIENSIVGTSRDTLFGIISTNPRFDRAQVTVRPFWKKTTATDPERIHVIVRPQL